MKNLPLPRPEAVFFDFDGILVDSEPMHYRAFIEVLDPLGMGFPWKEYVEIYMGFDDRDAFRVAFRAKGIEPDDANLVNLVAAKSRAFQDGIRNGVTAYPGAVALIESLHAAGQPLALCSGALRSDIAPILAQLGIARRFDVIVSADDVRRSKPDPESYALAFAKLSERYATPGARRHQQLRRGRTRRRRLDRRIAGGRTLRGMTIRSFAPLVRKSGLCGEFAEGEEK
jgi:beta-phosphoglucomutase